MEQTISTFLLRSLFLLLHEPLRIFNRLTSAMDEVRTVPSLRGLWWD